MSKGVTKQPRFEDPSLLGDSKYISNTPYEFQAPYRLSLNNQMLEFEMGQILVDNYLITRLLELGAPIAPRDPMEVKVFNCPHCGSLITTDEVPVIQRWLSKLGDSE